MSFRNKRHITSVIPFRSRRAHTDIPGGHGFITDVQCRLQCSSWFSAWCTEIHHFTEDLPAVVEKRNIDHHLYADDGQLSDHPSIATEPASIHNMEVCVYEVHNWCASKRLLLKPNKAEVIWFGTADKRRKITALDLDLQVESDIISPVSVVRNLGGLIDSELLM